jgi:methionyl-tRNA synthetase
MENTGNEATEKAADTNTESEVQEPDNLISIDQFMNVELRVAEILEVEAIPKSKKLVKLQVTLGETLGQRQILAGVAPYFEDLDTLRGRKIVVVANLKPAKLMGQESQGMLLAAATEDGSELCLVDPGTVPVGSQVR